MSEVMLLLVALGAERVDDRVAEREVLDPLRGPVGLDLGGRHAPHLLGVGLEEDAVEAPAEAGDDPALEVVWSFGGRHPRPDVGRRRTGAPRRRPRLRERVHALERVVEELASVVDAAHARPQ